MWYYDLRIVLCLEDVTKPEDRTLGSDADLLAPKIISGGSDTQEYKDVNLEVDLLMAMIWWPQVEVKKHRVHFQKVFANLKKKIDAPCNACPIDVRVN